MQWMIVVLECWTLWASWANCFSLSIHISMLSPGIIIWWLCLSTPQANAHWAVSWSGGRSLSCSFLYFNQCSELSPVLQTNPTSHSLICDKASWAVGQWGSRSMKKVETQPFTPCLGNNWRDIIGPILIFVSSRPQCERLAEKLGIEFFHSTLTHERKGEVAQRWHWWFQVFQ